MSLMNSMSKSGDMVSIILLVMRFHDGGSAWIRVGTWTLHDLKPGVVASSCPIMEVRRNGKKSLRVVRLVIG